MRFHPFRRRWTTGHPAERRTHAAPRDEGAPPLTPETQLAEETEAFLQGTLVELLAGQLCSLPPWLLVNKASHGDVDDLRRLAHGQTAPVAIPAAPPGYSRAWAMAERAIVAHLIRPGHEPDEIRRVQRDVLVPFELELITRSAIESLTLGAVVADAVAALDRHRLDH